MAELDKRIKLLCLEHTNKYHTVWPNEVGKELHTRINSINYRLGAIEWHSALMKNYDEGLVRKYKDLQKHNERVKLAIEYQLGFIYFFDDIIFNIISLFDYLASFINLVFTYNASSKRLKWNSINKKLRSEDLGFPDTSKIILEAHLKWVDKLAGYRSAIYHSKEDSSQIRLDDFPVILLPEKAKTDLPIFDKNEDISIIEAARLLIEYAKSTLCNITEASFNEKAKWLEIK